MKARLKKKQAKKAGATVEGSVRPQIDYTVHMTPLAVECWRIQKLLPEFNDNRKSLVLKGSLERMLVELAQLGIEVEDPEQAEYRDGMTIRVALFEETSTIAAGRRIIAETLEPAVYVNNRLVQQAKVIVSVGKETNR